MKKAKSQDGLLKLTSNTKKPMNIAEKPKPKLQLKSHIFRRLRLKHNSKQNAFSSKITDALIYNKNTHLSIKFKDDILFEFVDEYLKRISESVTRVPKIANYYKNYLTFFCNPIFRNFKINSIIQAYSDNKAELYYNRTYMNKEKKDKKNTSYMFDTKIKEEINNVMLTAVSGDNTHSIFQDNSVFNNEFFIYRPEKKRCINEELNNTTSMLEYSRNHVVGYNLLTAASKDEGMIHIISNMTKQPLNDKIYDKMQQKSTKKTGKNTYNFSTTDKSKGDSHHLNNILYNKESIPMKEFRDSIHKKDSEMMILEEDKPIAPNPNKLLHNFQITKITKNENIQQISYKFNPNTTRQSSLEKGLKKSLELVDVNSNKQAISSKLKLVIEPNHGHIDYTKSPMPVSQKYSNLDSQRNVNKYIDSNPVQNRLAGSGTKFTNLLSIGESSSKSQNNYYNQPADKNDKNQQKNNSKISSFTKIPIKAIKSIEINKYVSEIKSPYANMNLNYEYSSKLNEADSSPVSSVEFKNHKSTLSVQVDKVLRPSQSTVSNLLTYDKLSQLSQLNRVKSNDRLHFRNDDQDNQNAHYYSNDGQNNLSSNTNAYLNNSKKETSGAGKDGSNRILLSMTNTKTTINSDLKIKFHLPERSPSNLTNTYNRLNYYKEGKPKLPPTHYSLKNIGNTLVRAGSKPSIITEKDKEKPSHKKMKSTDLYYNNYLNSKINTTRSTNNYNMNFENKQKKVNFSPQVGAKKT